MSVFIGHSSGSKPSVAASAAADILEAELALGGTPPANRYYGTNATAVRGFYPLPTGVPGGGATNLGINLTATVVTLSSSSGNGVDIPAATVTLAGVMTAADRIKFNGIASGATANAADSQLRDRSTHTGTQAASTIAGSTTLSQALMTLANPSAVRYVRINADNSITLLDATGFREAIAACVEDDPRLTTNLGVSRTGTTVTVTSSTGLSAVIPAATAIDAGAFPAASFTKLAGIAAGATVNSPDATLLDRANHTGSQSMNTITEATAVGKSLLTVSTPPATRFVVVNAAGTVSLLDDLNFRSAIGAAAGAHAHPPTDIAGSTSVGQALMTLANPSAVRYVRVNADNSISLLDAAGFLAAIGGGAGSPAGTGTELQFRNGSAFGAVTGSSFNSGTGAFTLPWTTGTAFDVSGARLWNSACRLSSTGLVFWTNGGSVDLTQDLTLRRRAAADLAMGASDAAVAVAQTISVQSVVAGTSNTAGALWSFDASRGTGTAVGGAIRWRTAPAGSSGTAQNGFVDSLTVRPGRGIAISNGNFAAPADCIGEITVLRGSTTGTTPVILSESALGGGLPIPLNTVMQAIVIVQGMSEAGDVARYARQVCVKNFAGTSTLQSSPVTIGADDSGTTALSITVSDSTDTLDISVTGTAGTNWRWGAAIFGGELVRNVPV